ncbi:MAG: hypothetical protein IIT68_01190 [Treponema sp.]|nr:hypothetical protein [Treponema sp.]
MGLLETILTKPKPCVIQGSFASLCRAHGFIHALLLKRTASFIPIAVSGYDCLSAKKAVSTLSFWNGIIPQAATQVFDAKDDGFPFFQFFSPALCDKLRSVFIQRFKYGDTEYIFMAPCLTDEHAGTVFSGNDIKQLIKADSLTNTTVTIQAVQGSKTLCTDIYSTLENAAITSDSPEYTALLAGILEAYGCCAWATVQFSETLVLKKIAVLSLQNTENRQKTLEKLLSGTTDQSVSAQFTVTTERSAQKALRLFFEEEYNA